MRRGIWSAALAFACLLAANPAAAQSSCIEVTSTVLTCADDGSGGYTYQVSVLNTGTFTLEYAFFLGDPLLPTGVSFTPELEESLALAPGDSALLQTEILGVQPGDQLCFVLALHDATLNDCCTLEICLDVPACGEPTFVRGDCNADGAFDIADPIFLLGYLFASGSPPPCGDACDCNDDGTLDIADAICKLSVLFAGGGPPPAPYPNCGPDPTVDAVTCASFPPCP